MKWYGNYGRKVSWIVKRYNKHGRSVSWIVKWTIWNTGKLKSEMILKIWEKSRLKC
jgi:hypothetical protein